MTDIGIGLKNGTIALRWVHIVWWFLAQAFLIGGTYALTRYQVEDHERRLEKVEDASFVTAVANTAEGVSVSSCSR